MHGLRTAGRDLPPLLLAAGRNYSCGQVTTLPCTRAWGVRNHCIIQDAPVADGARQVLALSCLRRRPSCACACSNTDFPHTRPYLTADGVTPTCNAAVLLVPVGALAAPTITSAPLPAAMLISSTLSPTRMARWARAHHDMSFCLALAAEWHSAHVNCLQQFNFYIVAL